MSFCICICAYFYCFDSSVAGLSSPFIKFIFMKMIFMLTFVLYNVFIMFLVAAALVRKTTTTPNKTLFHSSVNELINPKKEYKHNDLFIVVFFLDIPSTIVYRPIFYKLLQNILLPFQICFFWRKKKIINHTHDIYRNPYSFFS